MPSLMAISHGTLDPASRFRVVQYLPLLQRAGWTVSHRPRWPDPWANVRRSPIRWILSPWRKWRKKQSRWRDIRDAPGFDVIFQNRDLLAGNGLWEQRLIRANPRVVFDFDDAIFLGEKRRRHCEWICRNAAAVTAGNEHLADFAREFSDRVTVLPTVVDTKSYRVRSPVPPRAVPLRLGWMGSDHSIHDTLVPHLDMLARLQNELGFDFTIISAPRPVLPGSGLKWRFVAWTPELETRVADWIDVGLMPLLDTAFQRGKCGFKLLQYMAAGLPVIASPVGVNSSLVPGHGYLAQTEADWKQAIACLQTDADLAGRLGQAGREFCERHYDLTHWAARLSSLLEGVTKNSPGDAR